MDTYNFTLVLEGADPLDEHVLDRLFDAGCDDAAFGERDGVSIAEFDRESTSFSDAVLSAVRAVEDAVPTLKVIRVEPDDLVTQAVIADRTGYSREGVRKLIVGERGPGTFPEPLARLDGKTRIWQWSDVASWFEQRLSVPVVLGGAPQFTAALNASLEARRQMTVLTGIAERHRESNNGEKLAFTSEALDELPALVEQGAEAVQRELATVGAGSR